MYVINFLYLGRFIDKEDYPENTHLLIPIYVIRER